VPCRPEFLITSFDHAQALAEASNEIRFVQERYPLLNNNFRLPPRRGDFPEAVGQGNNVNKFPGRYSSRARERERGYVSRMHIVRHFRERARRKRGKKRNKRWHRVNR